VHDGEDEEHGAGEGTEAGEDSVGDVQAAEPGQYTAADAEDDSEKQGDRQPDGAVVVAVHLRAFP